MEKKDLPQEICADTVTIEVTDRKTGLTFRRELPIDYSETANCIRMRGENIHGESAELAFYSNIGLGRLRDLTGGGADKDPCGGHSPG